MFNLKIPNRNTNNKNESFDFLETYNYTGQPEITATRNKNNPKNNTPTFASSATKTTKTEMMTAREFSINLEPEDIESVTIEIALCNIETIHGEMFNVLYDLYNIPRKNEENYTIIPFYLSRIGIKNLEYNDIDNYRKNKKKDYMKVQISKAVIHNKPARMLVYQVQKNFNKKVLYFCHPISHIIVMDNIDTLDLTINKNHRIKLKPDRKYPNCTLFSFKDAERNEHLINFSMIKDAKIENETSGNIYAINKNILRFSGGMQLLYTNYPQYCLYIRHISFTFIDHCDSLLMTTLLSPYISATIFLL